MKGHAAQLGRRPTATNAVERPPGARSLRERANRAADSLTSWLGSLPVLVGAVVLIVVWALTGPVFGFSDTWQLLINTTTTVTTFWMVFVIQNTANRQGKALQLKLDEIIRALDAARNDFVDLDHATEQELAEHEAEFREIAHRHPGEPSVPDARSPRRTQPR